MRTRRRRRPGAAAPVYTAHCTQWKPAKLPQASPVAVDTRDTPHPEEASEDEPFEEQRGHNHHQRGRRHRSFQTEQSGWHLNKDCRLCISSTYVLFLAAAMMVACTAYVGGYVPSYQTNRSARNDPKNVVCCSQVCKKVAKSIARSLNRSAKA
ncbi:hypothetical protein IscW_ISCW006664 [Ixodes scapularis]|uniref:Uncharacterized protein n=1 Tax=Ixodes scapularis TaxID=6945 RepID=B7PMR1_IXOSC|nr:hypothetical protein IscW_ISCW006664 [Ixodes scapularis]|eukprot:XP_002435059.1 hypothetical protein IscW_ISCW006664 [Ixodes scapularis]